MGSIEQCTIFDLRVTQINQDRGIPRYMHNLLRQIVKDSPVKNFYFMLDRKLRLPTFYEDFKAYGHFFFVEEGSFLFRKKCILNYFISCYSIPVANQNNFEFLFPTFLYGHTPYLFGMVWDLIPLIFPNDYMGVNDRRDLIPAYAAMREADHLFAISEQSALDAVRLLNIPREKISHISGGVGQEILEAIHLTSHQQDRQTFSFGTFYRHNYFVYIAGNDYRKNLHRMIKAYGLLSKMVGKSVLYPLVIICNMPEEAMQELRDFIHSSGLKFLQDVFMTGHISDIDLVRLLQQARGLIFPSLYEGLGLPILESYACGTPVIASNRSSMCEIVHPQCLFDPYDPQTIAAKIHEFSRDSALRQVSLEFGKNILKKFNWKNASALIIPYLSLPSKQKQPLKIQRKSPNRTLAMFSILPPDESGVAEYNYATFTKTPWNIHFYHHFPSVKSQVEFNLKSKNQAYHPRLFPMFNQVYDYQKAIFILGNSFHHSHGLNDLLHKKVETACENYIYLHDARLLYLWYAYFKNNFTDVKQFLAKFYPEKEKEITACDSILDMMVNTNIHGVRPLIPLSNPKKILVNSQQARELVMQDLGDLNHTECETLFLPIIDQNISEPFIASQRSETYIAHFGILATQKHPDILLEACKILNEEQPIKLIFAGYYLKNSLATLKLELPEFVTLFDSPSNEKLVDLMQQIDIAVQLRWPTDGGISGVVNQLLSLSKPVIATDKGFFGELKDFLFLTPEGITPSELAKVIKQTLANKDQLSQRVASAKQKFSLEVFFERFQNAIQL
jgi:glycosyltransferase involved in cell wall biosynthesis